MVADMAASAGESASQATGASIAGIAVPRGLPPLPSRPPASLALNIPSSSQVAPLPPTDAPPVSPRQQPVSPRATASAYVPPQVLLPLGVQKGGVEEIARRCVLAEAAEGFTVATIGRSNPAYGGEKVYVNLSDYFLEQIKDQQFSKIVHEVRETILADPGRHLKKLKKTTGAVDESTGQSNSIDCDYGIKLLQPLFSLICGDRQDYADCGLPGSIKSLFLALDRNLVKAMIHWREGQKLARNSMKEEVEKLKADKSNCDDKGDLKPQKVNELRERYGWIVDFYVKLLTGNRITAKYIKQCRINLFNGIIFTRCISPFLMPLDLKRVAPGTDASHALTKTSAAANKIFAQRYKPFCENFVAYSDQFLPDPEATKLHALEVTEQRLEKVNKKKKADGASDKKLAPRKGHASAPTLLQGKDFLEAMKKEASPVETDRLDEKFAASASSRAAQRHWIDAFRKHHEDALKANPALDLEFSKRLRKWRKKDEQLGENAFKEKLAELYKQARKEVARSATASLTDAQPVAVVAGNAEQAVSSPRVSQARKVDETDKSPKREKKVAKASKGLIALNDVQSEMVDKLMKDKRRRAYLERFPGLKAALKQDFLAWCNEGTGGSPALALQKIFEDLVVRHFFNAMRLRQKVSDVDFDKLKEACEEWPAKTNGWEKPKPEEMSFIWRTKVCAKPAPACNFSINVRMAEAAIDALLSDAAAGLELADDEVKNAFLNKAQPWLDSGAMGMGPEQIIRGYYEETLIKHFIKSQEPALSPADIVKLNEAVKREGRSDPDRVLTMAALRTLRQRLQNASQQS
jgi:hypothetical protein